MINFAFNIKLFDIFFGLAHQNVFLDFLGIFLADYMQYVLAAILLFYFFSKKHKKQHRTMVAVSTMSAVAALYIVKPLIVLFYAAPRPFVALTEIKPLIKVMTIENYQSFPSGHTLFFFALATTIFLFNKKLGVWFLIAATLIAVARVYVGVHWPVDILAGVILGVLTGIFTHYLYRKFGKRKLAK